MSRNLLENCSARVSSYFETEVPELTKLRQFHEQEPGDSCSAWAWLPWPGPMQQHRNNSTYRSMLVKNSPVVATDFTYSCH